MKSRVKAVIWPIIYLILIIAVCVSFILVFRSFYYRSIFVSGSSMEPTLHGNVADRVDFGIIDDHDAAIKKVKRFQIITTYYPFADSKDYVGGFDKDRENVISEDASYKIKRVYGLPGEEIKFIVDENEAAIAASMSMTDPWGEETQYHAQQAIQFAVRSPESDMFAMQKITFKRKIDINKIHEYANFTPYVLGDDEYWVMGDNYSASSDCFNKKAPIYRSNIIGVLVAIEGTCKIDAKIDVNSTQDGTSIKYNCKDRKRHYPTFY